MSLIKCSECNEELSDKASICPHCGNPIHIDAVPIKELFSFKRTARIVIMGSAILILLAIIFLLSFHIPLPSSKYFNQQISKISDNTIQTIKSFSNFFTDKTNNQTQIIESDNSQQITQPVQQSTELPTPIKTDPLLVQISSNGTKIYQVQYNNIWGYEFYTSKIDQTGNIDIGSVQKQKISKLLKDIEFPPSLTKKLAIIYVDPALINQKTVMQFPWTKNNISIIALQPEGGLFQTVEGGATIFINYLSTPDLSLLTHELGHLIGHYLTEQEWAQFYKLRGIPDDTPQYSSNWNLSPQEDFAEVYKAVYGFSTINTGFGLLVPQYGGETPMTPCNTLFDTTRENYGLNDAMLSEKTMAIINADPKLQECRKNNNRLSPVGGSMIYISQIDEPTKQFIEGVVDRINH